MFLTATSALPQNRAGQGVARYGASGVEPITCEEKFFIDGDEQPVDMRKSVFIATDEDGSKATAFLGRMKNANFIITNAKIKGDTFVREFFRFDGSSIQRGKRGFVAKDRDIYIIPAKEIPEGAYPIPVAAKVQEFARLGDEVRIVGNHSSGDFFELKSAKIRSIGAFMIEVDSPDFGIGSSGSPVVHVKTGMCIGMISHSFEKIESSGKVTRSRESDKNFKVRHYILRLDAPFEWMPLDSQKMEFLNKRVNEVYEIIQVSEMCVEIILKDMYASRGNRSTLVDIYNRMNPKERDLANGIPGILKIISTYMGEGEYSGMNPTKYKKITREYFNNFERFLFGLKAQLRSSEIDKYLPSDYVPINRRIEKLMEICKQAKQNRSLQ